MISDPDKLRDLLAWAPALGVISVCFEIDPGDRGEGWRIALRDELKPVVNRTADAERELRLAVEQTAQRIVERFPADATNPPGRCQLGFVEVARTEGEERWDHIQVRPRGTRVVRRPKPDPTSLVELVHDGAPALAIAVSSERVRLWRSEFGRVSEVALWEADFDTDTWRERRARVTRDPASAHFPTAAGKDQLAQRVAANRERFLREVGKRIRDQDTDSVTAIVAFGAPEWVRGVEVGLGNEHAISHAGNQDVVSEDRDRIAARLDDALAELHRQSELELVEHAVEATRAGGDASLGLQEILQALTEGRVANLICDPERPPSADGVELPEWRDPDDPLPSAMIEQALKTSATVTPVHGKAADALADVGGAAALLRY